MATQEQLDAKKAEIVAKRSEVRTVNNDIEAARGTIKADSSKDALRTTHSDKLVIRKAAGADCRVACKALDDAVQSDLDTQKATEIADLSTKKGELDTLRQEYRALKAE